MNDVHSSSTNIAATQVAFTSLPLYQQVYVADLVLGPAAAIAVARKAGVDLQKFDWWRIQLTPQARRQLEDRALEIGRRRKAEANAALAQRRALKPLARIPRQKSPWGRVK
jgi:hypothetical protein